ncbi:hypothetical protein KCP76_22510 [Salmonella enterica subsp. enterica serovar Weltevreden]|nr:hypothetical protein KCP76_22510 [Salmonella enterica subsp. enterica serovar Weltevreden]
MKLALIGASGDERYSLLPPVWRWFPPAIRSSLSVAVSALHSDDGIAKTPLKNHTGGASGYQLPQYSPLMRFYRVAGAAAFAIWQILFYALPAITAAICQSPDAHPIQRVAG